MPRSATNWKLFMVSAFFLVILFQTGTYLVPAITAHAQVSKTICVLQPVDQSIPSHVVNMTIKVLSQHNETSKYIGLVQELTDKSNSGCDYVIQFQRAVNSNYNWVDKTAHYTISGNTLTLYTDKTPVNAVDSIGQFTTTNGAFALNAGGTAPGAKAKSGGDVFVPVMTNWVCFAMATATFHQNIGSTAQEGCNPYPTQQPASDKIPFYIIHKALEQALGKMYL